ncbi:zinc ribbon domain-containing protein [Paenibacillus sp. UNC451MF]|uniref:zinc ribbon domain-containing protein n=1 Tax=Paenibacillus sp. UNC451MF TaxID=1449063 RepID=UPI00048C7E32|nr:zinc ribbon domain-containing protein [Paenibacillus sp. UNC451MF]
MATLVRHKESGKTYVLIGTGYGAYKSMLPGVIGGSLFPHEEAAEIPLAALSDRYGNITWMLTRDLQVIKVDGQAIGDYFTAESDQGFPSVIEESCPACGFRVASNAKECPSCGLTLIIEEHEDS